MRVCSLMAMPSASNLPGCSLRSNSRMASASAAWDGLAVISGISKVKHYL